MPVDQEELECHSELTDSVKVLQRECYSLLENEASMAHEDFQGVQANGVAGLGAEDSSEDGSAEGDHLLR